MQVSSFGLTHRGAVRDKNEDNIFVDGELKFFVVCDGMGGHNAGEVASALACETVRKYVVERLRLDQPDDTARPTYFLSVLREAVGEACREVYVTAHANPEYRGMGTTLTALLIAGSRAYFAHVGDSRLFLFRNGKLHQLSQDHTFVEEMVQRGIIDRAQAANHPYQHVLARSLGTQESVLADTLSVELVPGDHFLLCSDGVPDAVSTEELCSALSAGTAKQICEGLIQDALDAQCSDNVSVIIVQIEGEALPTEAPASSDALLKLEVLRGVFLFRELELSELARVVERCYLYECPASTAIIAEGDTDSSLYIVLNGELEVTKRGRIVANIKQGDHVGEMALVSGTPRTATVRTRGAARLLQLSAAEWRALLQTDPVLGVKLLSALSAELSSRLADMLEKRAP